MLLLVPEGKAPDAVWPDSAAREVTLSAFTAAFSTIGYVVGGDEALEPGFEKVALFADAAGMPSHAARQLPSGAWTSKLGVPPVQNALTPPRPWPSVRMLKFGAWGVGNPALPW